MTRDEAWMAVVERMRESHIAEEVLNTTLIKHHEAQQAATEAARKLQAAKTALLEVAAR